jgi:hypothetical protein
VVLSQSGLLKKAFLDSQTTENAALSRPADQHLLPACNTIRVISHVISINRAQSRRKTAAGGAPLMSFEERIQLHLGV